MNSPDSRRRSRGLMADGLEDVHSNVEFRIEASDDATRRRRG